MFVIYYAYVMSYPIGELPNLSLPLVLSLMGIDWSFCDIDRGSPILQALRIIS